MLVSQYLGATGDDLKSNVNHFGVDKIPWLSGSTPRTTCALEHRADRSMPGPTVRRADRSMPGPTVRRADRSMPGTTVRRADRSIPGPTDHRVDRFMP